MEKFRPDLLSKLLWKLPPETAHDLSIAGLHYAGRLFPELRSSELPDLSSEHIGLKFPHPLCLAAGFDKNARSIVGLQRLAFAAMEVGSVTLNAQAGNPKPRLFRLPSNQGLINRMGFNSEGLDTVMRRLNNRPETFIVGANLGLNKDANDVIHHFRTLARDLSVRSDYLTVNLSSPNTPGLRGLLEPDQLAPILVAVHEGMEMSSVTIPVLLKLSPDMEPGQEKELLDFLKVAPIDGIIACNTTTDREALPKDTAHRAEIGGLSGKPLANRANRMLMNFSRALPSNKLIVASGGIFTGVDIFQRLKNGADLVQIYTAFVYRGWRVVPQMLSELSLCMHNAGLSSISEIRDLK